jgi:hypothetical protein
VRDLARASGAIGASDDYVVLAMPAVGIEPIIEQYRTRQSGATKVKVLIMDGGTWDTLTDNASDASVARVVNAFDQLLAQLANDGTVEHLIYYLMPELPAIQGVAELRPLLQRACANSSVPCHFIDLQPVWAGHPEYTDGSGIQASEAGATVIADSIWELMQSACIAQ